MGNACLHGVISNQEIAKVDNDEDDKVISRSYQAEETGKKYIPFLNGSSWPGSILNWTQEDLEKFADCFTPHHVKVGQEVSRAS